MGMFDHYDNPVKAEAVYIEYHIEYRRLGNFDWSGHMSYLVGKNNSFRNLDLDLDCFMGERPNGRNGRKIPKEGECDYDLDSVGSYGRNLRILEGD